MCNHTVAMPTIQREITVPADRDAVWEALTDEELLREWLADDVELDPVEGGEGRFDDRQATVEAVEAGRYLAWHWARPGEAGTRVAFSLDDAPGGTRVVVVESAPSGAPWSTALPMLAATASAALCAA